MSIVRFRTNITRRLRCMLVEWDRLGRIFHAGTGSLTESGRRVRIRDKRGRPVRAFPAGWEGPVFFPGHDVLLWMELSGGVKITDGQNFIRFLPLKVRKNGVFPGHVAFLGQNLTK